MVTKAHISQTCWRVVQKAGGRVVIQDPQGQGPAGMSKLQRKRITQKASRFTLIGEDLMVYGHDGVLRRVLYKEEIGMVLTQCHEESEHQDKDQDRITYLETLKMDQEAATDFYIQVEAVKSIPDVDSDKLDHDVYDRCGN
ncbi:hypothetical protein GOP47_0017674 [Adiantum capillus-veneris]|uniref:Uncharacterized protein n=1 Tax=Adiantum capillus-veneris TaxID=13818 RepID=A0A9D4UFU1_ADICA|nr:hypothetical protein GOP47_0017674 [Adiantum capillus-veneris]